LKNLGYTLRKNRDKCEDKRTNRAVHFDIRWQQVPHLKNCGTTQADSVESVSLRRPVIVERGPFWRGARFEAIG